MVIIIYYFSLYRSSLNEGLVNIGIDDNKIRFGMNDLP